VPLGKGTIQIENFMPILSTKERESVNGKLKIVYTMCSTSIKQIQKALKPTKTNENQHKITKNKDEN